jgi:acyl dehydratase
VTITQEDVNLFADATGDHQWIHVDPERAANGPFGTTIAHGFMTLALLPRLQHQMYTVAGIKLAVNYGLNKVRFPAPVPVGSRVRALSSLTGVDELDNGAVQVTIATTVEIDGSAKPACVAESIVRYIP